MYSHAFGTYPNIHTQIYRVLSFFDFIELNVVFIKLNLVFIKCRIITYVIIIVNSYSYSYYGKRF